MQLYFLVIFIHIAQHADINVKELKAVRINDLARIWQEKLIINDIYLFYFFTLILNGKIINIPNYAIFYSHPIVPDNFNGIFVTKVYFRKYWKWGEMGPEQQFFFR